MRPTKAPHRRSRRRKVLDRVVSYGLLYALLRISFTLGRLAFEGLSCTYRSCASGCSYHALRNEGWANEKTYRFTATWSDRHVRNRAVYACIVTAKLPAIGWLVRQVLACPDVFYSSDWRRLFEVPDVCVSHSCLQRFGKLHYIYAEFVLRTFRQVEKLLISPPQQTPGGNVAVLVEARAHPLFVYTVKQVMSTLGPTWSLQLFLSDNNFQMAVESFEIYPGRTGQHIKVVNLGDFGLNMEHMRDNVVQSALSVHEVLYNTIEAEHILWFQLDVLLRHTVPSRLLKRVFLGSEWRGCEYPTCIPST